MKRLFLLLCLWSVAASLRAQQPVTITTDTASRLVTIENADRLTLRKVKADSANELLIGAGHVSFRDNKTKFFCDSAVRNKNRNIIEAFGNVHINDADSVHAYSQYLIYHIDTKMATLDKTVKLTDGKNVLTSENLDYDTRLRIGTYKNGGQIVSDKTVITSQEATYYSDLKDVYFKRNVKLKDPEYDLTTDSLLYNTDTRIASFITKTFIRESSGTEITTSDGYYDLKNKTSRLTGRSTVRDKSLTVTGNELAMEDSTGLFQASGNAVMIDKEQGVTVIANSIKANRGKNTFIATQHPLMILKQERDSIYVTADTLYSGILQDTILRDTTRNNTAKQDSTKRYFQGFHHVRIFSDSLQAVSDSLYYSGVDSVFRLFHDPILWANGSQVTGDTIHLYTKNKKPERLYVAEHAMMINQAGTELFNQLRGKTIDAYFKNGDMDHVQASGSPAESIYYIQDQDSAFVSMNTGSARVIDIYFVDSQLNKVVYRQGAQGVNYPIRQIPADKKKVENFNWQKDRRPKTKFELFEEVKPAPPPAAPAQKLDTPIVTSNEKKTT